MSLRRVVDRHPFEPDQTHNTATQPNMLAEAALVTRLEALQSPEQGYYYRRHPIRVLLLPANALRFGANNLRFGARRENRPLDRQTLRSLAG